MIRVVCLLVVLCSTSVSAQDRWAVPAPLAKYFKAETRRIADRCLSDIKTKADWAKKQETLRGRLQEMLGLKPWPKRTPLKAKVTKTTRQGGIIVENLHFQSRPGLYVTANLYRPEKQNGKLPAILYVCGHGRVKKKGVSYGNKTHYQHHGAWFARNGYVCLTIDTIQLGEIEGKHHGTYRHNDWWWICRGYTPAGVEAWNGIRAIDYLQSREEVDGDRIGVTGRSGGGAYSWWVAAIDTRVKCAVPVAGITNLDDHVVRGCVEGHCDCMYFVNTYQWDYPLVAALISPRPLLIANTDSDRIFPLPGVFDCYTKARRIYKLAGVEKNIALQISRGPHKDIQELRVAAFRWFDEHLKRKTDLITDVAEKKFQVEQLKVFNTIPRDQKVIGVSNWFVAKAENIPVPGTRSDWQTKRKEWLQFLSRKVFAGWPEQPGSMNLKVISREKSGDVVLSKYTFDSQTGVSLPIVVAQRATKNKQSVRVVVCDDAQWSRVIDGGAKEAQQTLKKFGAVVFFAPRGLGGTKWSGDARKQIQIRRRFYLLGQTADSMRVFDVVRLLQVLPQLAGCKDRSVVLASENSTSGIALYASIMSKTAPSRLALDELPESHRQGPIFFNVLKQLDIPQAIALAVDRAPIEVRRPKKAQFAWAKGVGRVAGWEKNRIRAATAESGN